MEPEEALLAIGWVRTVLSGHEAHRWFDLLSNLILAGLGYGEFVEEFEKGVAGWHIPGTAYPRL